MKQFRQRKTDIVWYHLYVESLKKEKVKTIETEHRSWLPGAGGEGVERERLVKGHKFSAIR